jgi:hypothetical protein
MGYLIDADIVGRPSTDLGIQNVHLITGEDYLGHIFFDPEDKQYIVERPIVPNVGFDQATERWQIAPLPLRPYLKKVERVVLDDKHVMWILPVSESMEKMWHQATSEILIPSGGPLNLTPRS